MNLTVNTFQKSDFSSMSGRRNYSKSMRKSSRNCVRARIKLREAEKKITTVKKVILMENEALKDPEYQVGTDLKTEANRLAAAKQDIARALRLIN